MRCHLWNEYEKLSKIVTHVFPNRSLKIKDASLSLLSFRESQAIVCWDRLVPIRVGQMLSILALIKAVKDLYVIIHCLIILTHKEPRKGKVSHPDKIRENHSCLQEVVHKKQKIEKKHLWWHKTVPFKEITDTKCSDFSFQKTILFNLNMSSAIKLNSL